MTIIGEGMHKMIVGDSLHLALPEPFKILDIDVDDPDGVSEEVGFGGNRLSIRFKQWRKREQIGIRAYVSTQQRVSEPPLIEVNERDVENGTFPVVNLCDRTGSVPSPILLRLPDGLRLLLVFATAISSLYWGTVAMYHFYLALARSVRDASSAQQLWLFEVEIKQPAPREEVGRLGVLRKQALVYAIATLRILAAVCLLLYLALTLVP